MRPTLLRRALVQGVQLGSSAQRAVAGGCGDGMPIGHIQGRCHRGALAQEELGLGTDSWARGWARGAVGRAFAWARRAGTAWSACWVAGTVVA